ncbi:cation:proton antiporter [Methanolobus halotolerans]|uniref:Sodium:proton exchanger n=1 Tax=Methanolobus halotolerans TaxID=2052935 RepID=A0A4E0PYF3_9EURY|nr:cation:proton antiporter [Methanolobus halotolerans]TGC10559.1 sodium:proton exchanger [Methanolobus halotolerans]
MELIGIFSPDIYDIGLFYLGIVILIAILIPRFLTDYMITAPIAYLLISASVFFFFPEGVLPHPEESPFLGKRLTEMGVIISLTAAGLKLTRPFAWQSWRYAARLLIITMPLTIALIALFGWRFLGFAPATAMLLGAVLAPTDPVLASDIQTTPPHKEDTSSTRLALTSEAGLNDGLAFPFTNMAIAMALVGIDPSMWFTDWLVTDFFYKIIMGTLVGLVTGWLLAKVIFSCPKPQCHSSAISTSLLAISLTLLPYGLAEMLNSYGFITVFVAACAFRYQETTHEYLNVLHDFSEEIERTLVVILFTMLGIYISHGLLDDFQWYMIPAALLIVLVIRPLTGLIGLTGTSLQRSRKYLISFYGIRGIGSIYYVLYAFDHAGFEQSKEALALVTTVIILSIFIHGLSSRPVMKRWDPE